MAAHKHAALMLLFAQDAKQTENPSDLWEFRVVDSTGRLRAEWISCGSRNPEWMLNHEYRRKPTPIETYHLMCSDGSMSQGYASRKELQDKRGKYLSGRTSSRFVRITSIDGKPIKIEAIE